MYTDLSLYLAIVLYFSPDYRVITKVLTNWPLFGPHWLYPMKQIYRYKDKRSCGMGCGHNIKGIIPFTVKTKNFFGIYESQLFYTLLWNKCSYICTYTFNDSVLLREMQDFCTFHLIFTYVHIQIILYIKTWIFFYFFVIKFHLLCLFRL